MNNLKYGAIYNEENYYVICDKKSKISLYPLH